MKQLKRPMAITALVGLPVSQLGATNILTDLELSLVTDVSGSVSNSSFQLMLDGYEAAFRSDSIVNAIQSGSNGSIAVNVVFFADSAIEGLPFTVISNSAQANAFADSIAGLTRPSSGTVGIGTNIASGIDLAANLFNQNTYDGRRVVIDVAGDGTGTSPGVARDNALNSGVDTINGIVIGTSDPNGPLAQFYENEVIGGDGEFVAVAPTFEDFEPEIESKIEREVRGSSEEPDETIAEFDESGRITSSTLRSTSVMAARTVTRSVGDRLFRMRAGVRSEPVTTTQSAPYSAKGESKSPIVHTSYCPWEVWGNVFWATQSYDAQFGTLIPGTNVQSLIQPDTDIDIYGGAVGFEYDLNENWSLGLALAAARSEADMDLVGSADVDTLSILPYISYYQQLGSMDFYADLLYGYGDNDYDTTRIGIGGTSVGSTEGDFHTLEFSTGLNFRSGQLVHGPFAQVRWLDGEIDGYTENGPGALVYQDQDYESLATQLGYQASYPIEMGSGVLVPQARAAWEHEFEEDLGSVAGLPLNSVDEDLAVLGVGVGYFMNCGWNVILDYEARLGSDSQSHYVGLKGGIEF